MSGMGETCNHLAAAMYPVETAVLIGLTSPLVQVMPMSGCQIQKLLNKKR